jgi:hypothetical protein
VIAYTTAFGENFTTYLHAKINNAEVDKYPITFLKENIPVNHTITWGTYHSSMRAPTPPMSSVQTITATSADGSAVNINCPTDSHYS